MAVKLKWAILLNGGYGSISDDQYIRRIPGDTEWVLLCKKPRYGKSAQKTMAKREKVNNFKTLQTEAKNEYNNNRAYWEARHAAALKEQNKHPKTGGVSPILWQYVKAEVFKQGNTAKDAER